MRDYFLKYRNFYKRLEKEYLKYGQLIIACDFDDTIYNYHKDQHRTYNQIINLLIEWRNDAYIIIFTSREDERLQEVKDFLGLYLIPHNSINKNKPDTPFGNNCKVYYNVLLDDRAGLKWPYKALRKLMRKIKQGKIKYECK